MSNIGPRLQVNLSALAENYKTIAARRPGAQTAAVVKADAYGLGLEPVARKLSEAGCTTFFVAYLSEARDRKSVV